jgi:hypothetical protein
MRTEIGILRPMSSAYRRNIYWVLLALMLVIVRIADAHAHICADGEEPPASIHLGDGSSHPCDDGQSNDHAGDKNVQIGGDVVLKKAASFDHPWIPAFVAFAFDFTAHSSNEAIFSEPLTVHAEAAAYLRPPLRGPPA